MLWLLFSILFCITMYQILAILLGIPVIRYRKRILDMKPIHAYGMLITHIAKRVKLDAYKRERLLISLERCRMQQSPEIYYAEAIYAGVKILFCSTGFLAIGMAPGFLLSVILSVVIFFQKIKNLEENIKKRNDEIITEFPMFIRNFSYSLEATRDIVGIIDRYRSVAGGHFKEELDLLITDMKTGNYEDAIQKFDRRLNLEPVTAFATGLMGISRGIDYKTYFFVLEENMKLLARETLKREVRKRPGKLQKAVLLIVLLTGVLYMVPILIQLKEGLGIFN